MRTAWRAKASEIWRMQSNPNWVSTVGTESPKRCTSSTDRSTVEYTQFVNSNKKTRVGREKTMEINESWAMYSTQPLMFAVQINAIKSIVLLCCIWRLILEAQRPTASNTSQNTRLLVPITVQITTRKTVTVFFKYVYLFKIFFLLWSEKLPVAVAVTRIGCTDRPFRWSRVAEWHRRYEHRGTKIGMLSC